LKFGFDFKNQSNPNQTYKYADDFIYKFTRSLVYYLYYIKVYKHNYHFSSCEFNSIDLKSYTAISSIMTCRLDTSCF